MLALGINPWGHSEQFSDVVDYFSYSLSQGNTKGIHPLLRDTESKVVRAEGAEVVVAERSSAFCLGKTKVGERESISELRNKLHNKTYFIGSIFIAN